MTQVSHIKNKRMQGDESNFISVKVVVCSLGCLEKTGPQSYHVPSGWVQKHKFGSVFHYNPKFLNIFLK